MMKRNVKEEVTDSTFYFFAMTTLQKSHLKPTDLSIPVQNQVGETQIGSRKDRVLRGIGK